MGDLRTAAALVRTVWCHPENRARRVQGLSRLVAWQVWERTVKRPWTVRLRGGLSLRCYPHSSAASAVIYSSLPDWWEMRFLLDHLQAGDTFVDVGANVGVYSLLAAGIAGVEVVSYEPSSIPWSRLVENVEINGLTSVRVCPCAVGSEAAMVPMTMGEDTTDRVVTAAESGRPVQLVPQVTLDGELEGGALDGCRVALVKIDVEGLEPEVLAGARRLIENQRPVLLIENNVPDVIVRTLRSLGYSFHRYHPPTRSLVAIDPLDTDEANLLACAAPTELLDGAPPEPAAQGPG